MIKEWLKQRSNKNKDKIVAIQYFELLFDGLSGPLKEKGMNIFLEEFNRSYRITLNAGKGYKNIVYWVFNGISTGATHLDMCLDHDHNTKIRFLGDFFARFLGIMSNVYVKRELNELLRRDANRIILEVAKLKGYIKKFKDFDNKILLKRLIEIFNENENSFSKEQKNLFLDIIILIEK